jgi:flagellar motility protein MotE (MotC chaperone)
MPPKKAASLIEKLDMNVIISLFSSMKGENVGQILPYVSAEKAAAISERLAKQGL